MEFFRKKSVEVLETAGAKKVWSAPSGDSRGGAHNRGTCRMGNDPKTSVVDKYHKAHDVPNLFIVDGSNFVTGGRNHPTMTIRKASACMDLAGFLEGILVRPSGFEPPTFCSGAIGTPSNPSCRYLGFQQLGASAFAQPTS